jgi:transposase
MSALGLPTYQVRARSKWLHGSEQVVKDIKRATRKQYSSEEKIRIVLDGLRGEDSIAELCRREGISQGVYYKWSKDFMEAGKKPRLHRHQGRQRVQRQNHGHQSALADGLHLSEGHWLGLVLPVNNPG